MTLTTIHYSSILKLCINNYYSINKLITLKYNELQINYYSIHLQRRQIHLLILRLPFTVTPSSHMEVH